VYCLCNCALLDREFDADRHCGVWVEDTGRQCTHSLTCKVGHPAFMTTQLHNAVQSSIDQLGVCGT